MFPNFTPIFFHFYNMELYENRKYTAIFSNANISLLKSSKISQSVLARTLKNPISMSMLATS
jgi:hypothetical protein